jgi:hypothetical protein
MKGIRTFDQKAWGQVLKDEAAETIQLENFNELLTAAKLAVTERSG